MITIHGRRNSSNVMPVMWTLGELGLDHQRLDVGGSFGGNDDPAYLAMNPNGKIPVMEEDGFVLWESQSIVRYLCEQHGRGGLLPEDARQAAEADQWHEWYKSTVFPVYIGLFVAVIRTEEADRDPLRIEALAHEAADILNILETRLDGRDYVMGDRLTMADIGLGCAIHRYLNIDVPRPALPRIEAWHQRLSDRPAYREHVMFPFGSNFAEWRALERETGRPA